MAKPFPDTLINQYFDELDKLGYKPSTIAEMTGIDRTTIFRIKKHERFPTKSMWIKLTKPFRPHSSLNYQPPAPVTIKPKVEILT